MKRADVQLIAKVETFVETDYERIVWTHRCKLLLQNVSQTFSKLYRYHSDGIDLLAFMGNLKVQKFR